MHPSRRVHPSGGCINSGGLHLGGASSWGCIQGCIQRGCIQKGIQGGASRWCIQWGVHPGVYPEGVHPGGASGVHLGDASRRVHTGGVHQGVHAGGCIQWGGSRDRDASRCTPHIQTLLRDTVSKWAVRILLERILVLVMLQKVLLSTSQTKATIFWRLWYIAGFFVAGRDCYINNFTGGSKGTRNSHPHFDPTFFFSG